jgi:tRNA (adenine57-N1/adenine58-N1)-methyltransferase
MSTIQDNGLILIIYKDRKYLKRISREQSFHGKGGAIQYSDLIGMEYGIRLGEYDIYEPTIEDIIMYAFKRETQVVYPKDSFYIAFKINARNASRVLEVGDRERCAHLCLAHAVGPDGKSSHLNWMKDITRMP